MISKKEMRRRVPQGLVIYLLVFLFSGKQKVEYYESAEEPSITAMCSHTG